MHVFIDTNIFEQDPYWKNAFAKILLDVVRKGDLKLYISEIVYEELRIHTIRNHKKAAKELYSKILSINKFRQESITTYKFDGVEKEFEDFYRHLTKDCNTQILGYKKISFEKVMERVLRREKPFNDEKTEVKDCGIWLTYAEFVEEHKLRDCFLLSNNTKDFYSKEPISQGPTEYRIHEQLEKDTNRFRCFPSIKDFVQIIIEPHIKASKAFKAWLESIDVDASFIIEIVKKDYAELIESKIQSQIDRADIASVYDDHDWYLTGEVDINEIEWWDCQEIETVVLENSCIVSAQLDFRVQVEGHAYNPSHDDVESKYYSLGEREIEFHVMVSFTLLEGGVVESLDITDIEWHS